MNWNFFRHSIPVVLLFSLCSLGGVWAQTWMDPSAVAVLTLFLLVLVMTWGLTRTRRLFLRLVEVLHNEAGRRGSQLEKNMGMAAVKYAWKWGVQPPICSFTFSYQDKAVRVGWPKRELPVDRSLYGGDVVWWIRQRLFVEFPAEQKSREAYAEYLSRFKHLNPRLDFDHGLMILSSEDILYQPDQLRFFIDTALQMSDA